MQKFQFRAAGLLRLREVQLDNAQAELHRRKQAAAQLAEELAAIERAIAEGGQQIKSQPWVDPASLANLSQHRASLDRARKQCLANLEAQQQRVQDQENVTREANRAVRLIEKVRERKQSEWQTEADREAGREIDDFQSSQRARAMRESAPPSGKPTYLGDICVDMALLRCQTFQGVKSKP